MKEKVELNRKGMTSTEDTHHTSGELVLPVDSSASVLNSEEKYRVIMENLPCVIYTADPDGMVLSLNKASKKILGYDPDEIIGRNFLEFIAPEFISKAQKYYRRVINGNIIAGETVFYRKDGVERCLEFAANPLIMAGKVVEVYGILNDISDRRKAEEQLRRMLEAVTDAVIVTDLKGIITQINEKALETYGFNKKESLLSRCIFELISPSDQKFNRREIHKAMESGPVRDIEYKLIREDGSEFWAESNVGMLKDNFGKPEAYISMTRDISERKYSEDMLRRSQEKLQSIVMAMPDGLFHINRFGTFLDERMGHKSNPYGNQNKFMGKNLHDVLPDDFADKLLSTIEIALDRNTRQVILHKMTVSPGNEAVFEIRIVPYGSNEVIAIARDITESVESEKRLRIYQYQLQSLSSQLSRAEERERRRLATDLHDLIGQPLAVIKMKLDEWADFLNTTRHAGEIKQILELLEGAIQNTRSLTFDLSSPILHELGIEAGLESLMQQFKERYSLYYEYNDDGQEKPLDDEVSTLLYRCISELLMNVVKHAKAKLVKLYISREDSQILITVEDDGIGFSISDSDGRLHKFGLFSIQERLKGINGSFIIQSKTGYGTQAIIRAPLKQTEDSWRN